MAATSASRISEHVVEVRFKPNARILDRRGEWAERASKDLSIPHWRIVENRVDLFDADRRRTFFFGFRNCGCTLFDADTVTYFHEQASKFLRYLMSLDGFGSKPYVERIGVRSKFIAEYAGTFEELLKMVAERYVSIGEAAKAAIAGKLVDIGTFLNMADEYGNCNTVSGPMNAEQMKNFIDRKGPYPDVGLFYDIDYWLRPSKAIDAAEVTGQVKEFAVAGWERFERIRKLIFEG